MSKLYTIPIAPQVATRPRVPRFGKVFYGKKYTAFRKEAEDFFRGYKALGKPFFLSPGSLRMVLLQET